MKNIKCTIRFDDICPTMDWEQFHKAILLMEKYNIKPLLGVIPNNKDPEQVIDPVDEKFWEKIRSLQKKGYEIALHGCYHVYDNNKKGIVTPWGNGNSEFAGNSYQNQFEKIRDGKKILESHGIKTDIFFAPSHNYDSTTLKALYDNGFRYISDGKSRKPYVQEKIKCIPCRFFGTPKVHGSGVYISVCHPNKWKDYPNNYKMLVEFCEKYNEYMVPYLELKQWQEGNYIIQKIDEKLYIFFIDLIRRKLSQVKIFSYIYHKVFGR